METTDIEGETFTECDATGCEHNSDRTMKDDQQARVCAFGAKTWVSRKKPIPDCHHKATVVYQLAEQGRSPHRFDEEEGARVFDEMFYPPEDPQKSPSQSD